MSSIIKNLPLKQPNKREEITAAEFNRVLDMHPATSEAYTARSIYPNSLYEKTVAEYVLDYFHPTPRMEPWKMKMYTGHGKAAEQVIQQTLFHAGVLDCPHRVFKETSVYCPRTGISGRTDGILLKEKLKALGAVKPILDFEGESERIILEIKETSQYQYSLIKHVRDIPMKFQWAQCAYQRILGIPRTCFLYVNRDGMTLKTKVFESTDAMWDEIQAKCAEVWKHVAAETIPTDEGDVSVWKIIESLG